MDNSGNGFNKTVVLLAVGILGIAAGQYLFKTNSPIGQQPSWPQGYGPQQPPMAYAQRGYTPGYFPPQGYAQSPFMPQHVVNGPGTMVQSQFPVAPPLSSAPQLIPSEIPNSPMVQSNSAWVAPARVVPTHGGSLIPTTVAQGAVTLAAGLGVPGALGATLLGAASPTIQIESVSFGDIIWTGGSIPFPADGQIKVNVKITGAAAGDALKFSLQQEGSTTALSAAQNTLTMMTEHGGEFDFPAGASTGTKKLVAELIQGGNPTATNSRRVVFPTQGLSVSGLKVSVCSMTESTDILTPSIHVYHKYVQVTGQAKNCATVSFSLYESSTSKLIRDFDRTVVDPTAGTFVKALTLPIASNESDLRGILVIRGVGSTGDRFSDIQSIQYQTQPQANVTGRDVEIKLITQGATGTTSVANGYASQTPIKVTGRLLKPIPDGRATLYVVSTGEELVSSVTTNAATESLTFPDWTPPSEDNFELAIRVYQGDQILATSDKTRQLAFRQTGPTPKGVSPDNLDLTPNANVLRVQFDADHPLNRAEVESVKDTEPGKRRFELTSSRGAKPTLLSATLDADAHTVELRFDDIPPETYRLTIKKEIRDLYGNFLLANGPVSPGKDHDEFVVFRSGTSIPPSPSPGLKGITGPYVPYQEYTKPRLNPTGFNPSDKVVTRVSRLYYYRDAHRVVQIIKRDAARSHNRQAVDMQQQLADKARRDAENATGERQASERAAIQSAQRARTAETTLTQLQQALVQARQQVDELDSASPNQDERVAQLQTKLEDNQNEQKLPTTDPSKLALLKTEEAQLRRELSGAQRIQAKLQNGANLPAEQTKARTQVEMLERRVNTSLAEVQNARDDEAEKREDSATKEFKEDLKHKDLFRREVAAAHEDPDTYAPGVPKSDDPVEQVSLSVIGEGLIQMRGPLKGVNLVRTMINEIDAPVGQVKVAIHTVQVNGEHGKRMEPVVGRIQRYIDHSRFLTTQSSQMLRNAVTLVASRRADEAIAGCEGLGQHERDQKYIEAFFGREFLAELRTLDSEFLHTGNKLLSLHSMDSTSLASALFLLSLAKNDVRQEILQAFEQMVSCQLPEDEMEYFTASTEKYKFGPPFHKTKFEFLGHNAKFVSLKGFFNAEVAGAETLTPMQREFIRLAQIFKSRLVTEIELQQRVMERSLIEDRIQTNYLERLQEAELQERKAKTNLEAASGERQTQQRELVTTFAKLQEKVAEILVVPKTKAFLSRVDLDAFRNKRNQASRGTTASQAADASQQAANMIQEQWTNTSSLRVTFQNCVIPLEIDKHESKDLAKWTVSIPANASLCNKNVTDVENAWKSEFADSVKKVREFLNFTYQLNLDPKHADIRDEEARYFSQLVRGSDGLVDPWNVRNLFIISIATYELGEIDAHVNETVNQYLSRAREFATSFRRPDIEISTMLREWNKLKSEVLKEFVDPELRTRMEQLLEPVDKGFDKLIVAEVGVDFARRLAESSRRPLDHKKFLDMLIDDVEDKFIELMEGTRAHTANIDNYLSRLGQALEDDFNTQFYFPAFKGIREASRYWDVSMGQIETTTILTNNRTFAKVSPQATMEFDLPKRDILIQEAFESAQAAYDDYGALLGDPTFLSLVKMHRGQPPSAQYGSGNSVPTTRNVLPGLPSSTDEGLVAQNRAVAPDFPSALESLIPDPAIYKFETGTGFEIRPVIQPDGQAVVFHFNYMYTTNVREPVRADEKHLGRVKRHFIDTDVQIGNYEMREVSKYQVALKASRTSRGVPLLEDIPGAGVLFRPQPSQESSLQENIILAQTAIFPTLFDLMGLRWAPAVADLDALRLREADFVTRGRQRALRERVFDYSSQQVDDFMRIPAAERRSDLYRSQETIPSVHPNGYSGPGLNQLDGVLREGYSPEALRPESRFVPGTRSEGAVPRGVPAMEGILLEGPPPGAYEFSPPSPNGSGYSPAMPLSPPGMEPAPQPVPSAARRWSQKISNRPVEPATGPQLELQSYRTEAKPTARSAPPPSAPRSSRPVPKSTGSPPGLLPATSSAPERLPTPTSRVKPTGPSGMSTSQHGFSSPTESSTPSRPVPVNPVREENASSKQRASGIVQVNATEPAKAVEPEPVAPKKKFGVPSMWSKKP